MDSSLLSSLLDRLQRLSRNAEKTLSLECRNLQTKLEHLPVDIDDRVRTLRSAADSIEYIQSKIIDYNNSKQKVLDLGQRRLGFISNRECDDSEKFLNWLLTEYMARRGWLKSARILATATNLTEIVDLPMFEQAHQILKALDCHNTAPALQWCHANASRLQAIESRLEFHLHLRDFVSLVEKREFVAAIVYVKKYMVADLKAENCLLKKHLALVALLDQIGSTQLAPYSQLLHESVWGDVKQMFLQDFYRVSRLCEQSQLDFHLKTGLSALKTQRCGTAAESVADCPVCGQDVVELAAQLKPASRTISCLICRLNGSVMDESNPPLAIPNGQVYSKAALEAVAALNDGMVHCPETGANYPLKMCRNVFVL